MTTIGISPLKPRLVGTKCNLLLFVILFLFSCTTIKGQQNDSCMQYDDLTQRYVYTFVEKMPFYRDGDMAFVTDFIKNFRFDSFLYSEEIFQTKLQVQFVIDDKGNLIGERVYNKTTKHLTDFEKAGLKALNSMQNWQAGIHEGKAVNVILTRTIHIDMNW